LPQGRVLEALTTRARELRADFATGPMQIALSTAVRASLSTVLPLAMLPHLGYAALAYPAVLGALATSLVDVGGPYRTRLLAMLAQALLGACLLLLGSAVVGLWWLAAAVVAAIGILSGLIRALGQGGVSLGTNMTVALLVGVQLGQFRLGDEKVWALGYSVGGLWTVLITLIFWELRPYRRLKQEVASVWDAVAKLLATSVEPSPDQDTEARERRIVAAHAAVRAALEQSRDSLSELGTQVPACGTAMAQLAALREAASGIAACSVTLSEAALNASGPLAGAQLDLAAACRAVARALVRARPAASLKALSEQLGDIGYRRPELPSSVERVACAQASLYLNDANRALSALFAVRSSLFDLMRLSLVHRGPRGTVVSALRSHARPQSPIFRHAMRASAVGALGTTLLVSLRLPHGLWLPVSALAILQPEYGGTITRAVQRSLGTVAGAVIASVLLATLRGTAAYDAALGMLLFATFLLIRRNYGYGIVFLTPLVIMLVGMTSADPWVDLAERVAYTMAGALLALAAGYALWPQWERDQLRERLVRAIDADKAFLEAVLQALVDAAASAGTLETLRRQAEISLSNAEAGLQRMLVEPAHPRPLFGLGFAVLIHLHRLCRHAIALSGHLGTDCFAEEPLTRLRLLISEVLEDVLRVIRDARLPVPWPSIRQQLSSLVAASVADTADSPAATLLGYIERDLTGLLSAAGYDCTESAPSFVQISAPSGVARTPG
jgi:uncharacterized membrane protein YccC